jgi:serine/threonine-protein kinase
MSSSTQTLELPGYQVMQFLGSGARSTIWQVRDTRTHEVFALKRVVKHDASDLRFLEQAVNEYDVASRLDHKVIRKVHHLRRVKKWMSLREVLLVMELCDGSNVQSERPTEIPEIIRIFSEVAGALAYMNSQGFVHADMKPNNIIVSPSGAVKIIDLGQSCTIGTVKQRIQGTPDYIAPEQVLRRPLDARTDVFNFGASLYWTITGKPIPTCLPKTGGAVLITDQAVPLPEELNPATPIPLSRLVMDCIQIQPNRRPATMTEVASRLSVVALV